ncbi:methyltransferase [Saccharospirillum salsuginis]|uniref:Methyltransferase small domain-containing protein n=1 Tax=Saccharospirillum salsuginis TaxID=418750 RepID=A0A918JZL6_9GAMM|nr:methyltransferase [Saccharospirillum salsuginis]GGX38891.1 hypothetical protein GCM10007392_01430 [Saccharospirillum salsuginis]
MTVIVGSLCLLALMSILYSTLRTSVPPMPSSGRSRRALLDCLSDTVPEAPAVTLVDLGSGWGSLVIAMARRFPRHRVEGYELSWLPWMVSRLLKAVLRLDNLTLHRGDFLKADLRHARVLVCYLNPTQMARLCERFDASAGWAGTLFSVGFAMPGARAERTVRVNELYNTPIYQYRLGHG